MQKNSPFKCFVASHKDASFVRACAMHYRTTPYGYIIDWCKRNKVSGTDVASALMSYYAFKWGE